MRGLSLALLVRPLLLLSAACDEEPTDACTDVDCGDGRCFVSGGEALCACFRSYIPVGLDCRPATDGCLGVTCEGHGHCVEDADSAALECDCDVGFTTTSDGFHCVPGDGPDGDADGDGDGDADADADGDSDGDADADGDVSADADPDVFVVGSDNVNHGVILRRCGSGW